MTSAEQNCPNCQTPLKLEHKLCFNVYRCPKCRLRLSDAVFNHSFESDVQVEARDAGLKNLRLDNFRLIANRLQQLLPANSVAQGLEIGPGNGWWLKTCQDRKINCAGIEPERTYEPYHQQNGLKVYYGFYPQTQTELAPYDFIIFNDVFEHIPNINQLTEVLHKDLKDDGLLIINLPMSTGLFYRLARVLNYWGISSFLERMWQFNFHSPHFTYFNATNLTSFITARGFDEVSRFRLKTLDFSSLQQRITTDKRFSKVWAWMLIPLLKILRPVIAVGPADTKTFIFKKRA